MGLVSLFSTLFEFLSDRLVVDLVTSKPRGPIWHGNRKAKASLEVTSKEAFQLAVLAQHTRLFHVMALALAFVRHPSFYHSLGAGQKKGQKVKCFMTGAPMI